MALGERIEDITPWGEPGKQSLSWFALSLGRFWMNVGPEQLFRYSPSILEKWNGATPYAEYQVAAFLRDVLGAVGPALGPLPAELEALARDRDLLADLNHRA